MTKLLDYHTFVETDYSRFDMTISLEWLELVQNYILKSCYPDNRLVHTALDLSLITKGVSATGWFYDVIGTRCSGDAHTSIGNGLLNMFNTYLVFGDVNDVCAFHEGDDGVIALKLNDAHHARQVNLLTSCGFVIKKFVTTDINTVSFCGRFLAQVGSKLVSYADPLRSMSKLHITTSTGPLPELLLAKMMSYAHTDQCTPIIGPLTTSIVKLLKPLYSARVMRRILRDRYVLRDTKPIFNFDYKEVNERLRSAFSLRTGVSISNQIAAEEYYRKAFSKFIPERIEQVEFGHEVALHKDSAEVHYMPTVHSWA